MMGFIDRVRLVPIVLCAVAGLFVLKLSGIVMNGGYTLGAGYQAKADRVAAESAAIAAARREPAAVVIREGQEPARPKMSWAQDVLGYPDITGSVGGKPAASEAAPADKPAEPKTIRKVVPKPPVDGTLIQPDASPASPAERALLERLAERRRELERRASELEMRDTLLKEAEKRLETRLAELTATEERIAAATQKKEESESARLKNLVTMYENMKAKDAARIFDRLEIRLATEVARLIQPRRMSDIMAQMTPEAAERLTVELANINRTDARGPSKNDLLPKIEGRPSGS